MAQTTAQFHDTLARGAAGAPAAADPQPPWPERHPWLSGIATFLLALIVGRALLFVQAVEQREPRDEDVVAWLRRRQQR